MPKFEFDEAKSIANLEKHGIDFIEAKEIWKDLYIAEFRFNYDIEPRFGAIAKIKDKYWTAVYTMRGENIRIISVRRSRDVEKEIYKHGRI